MSEPAVSCDLPEEPDVSHLVTEDDQPVDNFFHDKQMDILTEALRVSWPEGRPFLSASNVGLFYSLKEAAIVPDVMLSVGVTTPADCHEKNRRSYYFWLFGKPPDIVIEIVSNREGDEDTRKLQKYCEIRVPYYIIFDPWLLLSSRPLRIFQLSGASYVEKVDRYFPELGLGLSLWDGEYDGMAQQWLRWANREGQLLATGTERSLQAEVEHQRAEDADQRAEAERQRAEAERQRAEDARQRAEDERQRAEEAHQLAEAERQRAEEARQLVENERQRAEDADQRAEAERQRAEEEHRHRKIMAAKLRELGIDPETLG